MEINYFGLCLAQFRRKKKLRQKQVAYDAGMDPSYVAALENGRRLPPRQNMMAKLIKAVNASEQEEKELRRTAILSQLAKELDDCAEFITGASAAMMILELSSAMSEGEIQAIATLVEGYRYRTFAQGRNEMK